MAWQRLVLKDNWYGYCEAEECMSYEHVSASLTLQRGVIAAQHVPLNTRTTEDDVLESQQYVKVSAWHLSAHSGTMKPFPSPNLQLHIVQDKSVYRSITYIRCKFVHSFTVK